MAFFNDNLSLCNKKDSKKFEPYIFNDKILLFVDDIIRHCGVID